MDEASTLIIPQNDFFVANASIQEPLFAKSIGEIGLGKRKPRTVNHNSKTITAFSVLTSLMSHFINLGAINELKIGDLPESE